MQGVAVDTTGFIMDGFLYIHRAMRKDINNLVEASKRLTRMSVEDAAKLQKWFQFFWEMVEIHHKEEDNNFFPDITRRATNFAGDMARLTNDHQELHQMVEQIGRNLGYIQTLTDQKERENAAQDFTRLATRFEQSLNDHLDREEAVVVPTVAKYFSEKDQKAFQDKGLKSAPLKHMSLLIPWVGSALDEEEQAVAIKVLPLPLRIMYNLSWRKKYEKFTAVFHT